MHDSSLGEKRSQPPVMGRKSSAIVGDYSAVEAWLRVDAFRERHSDRRNALEIASGHLRLSARLFDATDNNTFSLRGEELASAFIPFHSLRWVDILRRTNSHSIVMCGHWQRAVNEWWRANNALDRDDRLWNPIVTLQRTVALALGGSWVLEIDTEIVEVHLQELQSQLDALKSATHVRQAIGSFAILYGRLDLRPSVVRDFEIAGRKALKRFVRPGGLVVVPSLGYFERERSTWMAFLECISTVSRIGDAATENLGGRSSFPHLVGPDGRFVEFGSSGVEVLDGRGSSELDYALSSGRRGSASDVVTFVDEQMMVSSRSGWGETERSFGEETFWTMLVGEGRGADSHEDLTRITYTSQGVNWLIDPMSHGLGSVALHSTLSFDDMKYRKRGSAEIITARSDGRVDDFVVRSTAFHPVKFRRHVVFARTGNYLVVEDKVNSSKVISGHQQWIINGDVDVSIVDDRAILRCDGKVCELAFFGIEGGLELSYIFSEEGALVAKKLSAPFAGTALQIITVVIDVVDEEHHSVRKQRVSSRKNFVVGVRDSGIDENLVVTVEGSHLVSGEMVPEVALGVARQMLAGGELSSADLEVQRCRTHAFISELKAMVRGRGGTPDSREIALEKIASFAAEQNVIGLRDHGLAATAIDLVGQDLEHMLDAVPSSGSLRRSALINWTGGHLLQPFYRLPLSTTCDAGSIPDIDRDESIWSVDLGVLVPSTLISAGEGESLVCYFHGATDRTRQALPRYERRRSFSTIGAGPVMYFADPTLDLDSRSILSWFLGTSETNLHAEIARMIDAAARRFRSERVVLVGNSGGGFAALQVASYLDGASVIAVNSQVLLSHYQPRIVDPALWASFGCSPEISNIERRSNVLSRYREIEFDVDVFMYQNSGDEHHMREHFEPFVSSFAQEAVNPDRLVSYVSYLGDGHLAPPARDYVNLVRERLCWLKVNSGSYRGLRRA